MNEILVDIGMMTVAAIALGLLSAIVYSAIAAHEHGQELEDLASMRYRIDALDDHVHHLRIKIDQVERSVKGHEARFEAERQAQPPVATPS
jgi:hypothetical protein